MRIAFDARPLCTPVTGIGRYTDELLKRLICDETNQWFAYSSNKLNKPLARKKNLLVREGCAHSGLGSVFAQAVYPVWARRDRIDVFWSPRHHLPLLLGRNRKTVVTIHDLVWKRCPATMTVPRRWLERVLMPPSLKKANTIVAVSRATANDLNAEFAIAHSKLETITPGTFAANIGSKTLAEADILPKCRYILFVGTLEPRKNLLRVLSAFGGMVNRGLLSHHLVIVGAQGWGKVRVEEYVVQSGLREYVELTGRVSDERLFELYRAADFLVMPSLYEGFGLPLVEAMSFGVPVISSNLSSMPEVVGDAGLLVDPSDTKAIEQAMASLAQNRQLHQELKEKAILQAQNFCWDAAAHAMLKIFQQFK